jgi:hypothetical protein
MSTLEDAIQAIRLGNLEDGRQILEELLEIDENDEEVWLWLSAVVDSDEDREICLENVLALNPSNHIAQRGAAALKAGSFNPHLILDELIEIDKIETPDSTFIDEFVLTDDDSLADEEIKLPSTMAGAQQKKQKTRQGCGLSLRVVLIALVALLIVVVLAGLAAANLFLGGGGDNGGPTEDQSQEVPVEGGTGEQSVSPPATDTPAPTPTDTPTPTRTPFVLPTPKPTPEPTPTATQVVAPTPN